MLRWIADRLLSWHQQRRRVRFSTHVAQWAEGGLCYFLNVTNLSHSRDVEITHVFLALEPPVNVVNDRRPLPERLRPDESWETWIAVGVVPAAPAEVLLAGGSGSRRGTSSARAVSR
jgi:hypothetical protein